jgi:hypothetical protein
MMKRHIYLAMTTLVLAQGSANAGGFSPDAGSMLANTQSSLSAHTEKQLEGFPLEYQPKLRWTDDFSVQGKYIDAGWKVASSRQRLCR